MQIVRYTVGAIGFLLVWFVVAVVVGLGVTLLLPGPQNHTIMIGIGLDWRNIPGTILGLLAGIQSFRASINRRK